MDKEFENELLDSLDEWSDIERLIEERTKKDKKIISKFCANNDSADIFHILELLEKHKGLPEHDRETVKMMKLKYPKELDCRLLNDYLDMTEIYNKYLESGGGCDD